MFGGLANLDALDGVTSGGGTANDGRINLAHLNGTNGFMLNGVAAVDYSGFAVSGAGDVNGDGFDDLLIGAHFADPNGSYSGQSYVVFGGPANLNMLDDVTSGGGTANDGRINLAHLNGTNGFALNGIAAYDYSGRAVSGAGDVNGDGFDDLLIGANRADPNGSQSGQSYLVFGGLANLDALDDVPLNGGTANDGRINLAHLNGTNGFVLNGLAAYDGSGISVSGAGDVNGDGFDDLLIGAHNADPNGSNSGQSYVVFGGLANLDALDDLSTANDGRINLAHLNGTNGFMLNGLVQSDNSGIAVSGAGDVNGDGFADLLIGAYEASPGVSQEGQSYVVFGGNFTNSATQVGTAATNTLTGSAAVDVLVGGRGHDVLIGNSGADVLYGGEGDDILAVSSTSTPFARIDGGHGADTLRLDGSGLMLNLTAIADNKLTSIEVIDIRGSGANTLTLNLREVLNLTAATNPAHTANTLAVRRDADDTLDMGVGWTQGGNATINGDNYQVFTQGAATLQVEVAAAVDTTAPGLSITPDGTTTNASLLTFTFQFTETVTGFDPSDVALTNGTKGAFTAVDGDTYTLLVTPTSDGAVSASVAADAAQDAATNGNTSATALVTSDRTIPILTISPNGTTTNASLLTFTFQFSETVSGFEASDVMVTNGTKGTFTAMDGDTYTLLVTPTADGVVSINVAANSAQDAATNGNTAASAAVTSNRSGPALVIDDVSVTEGHQGTNDVVFTIVLRNPPNKTVELGVATAAGTATAGSDFYGKCRC